MKPSLKVMFVMQLCCSLAVGAFPRCEVVRDLYQALISGDESHSHMQCHKSERPLMTSMQTSDDGCRCLTLDHYQLFLSQGLATPDFSIDPVMKGTGKTSYTNEFLLSNSTGIDPPPPRS